MDKKEIDLKVIRLRTELAFLFSDRGGPDHSKEIEKIRNEIHELLELKKNI